MKTLILGVAGVCVAVVGLASYAAGQSTPTHLTSIVYGPSTKITANDITYDEARHTTFARGHVRIVSETSTITADEADMHHLKATRTAVDLAVDLRGNVRVVIAPSTKP
jgi:lipopolysaccharide assembly outer membrane protein LptD (OstA)